MRLTCVLVLLIALRTSALAQNLTPPLTFHASFDGTVDATARGSGKSLKVEGPVAFRPGRVGQALLCGEGGASVRYATSGNLRAAAGTVELWVCPLDWTGEEDEFHVFLEALDPGWLVLYRYYQGGITMLTGTGGPRYTPACGDFIHWQPGEWHHVAGTWRARGLEVYVDGVRQGLREQPLLPEQLAESFVVGDRRWHVARQRQTLVDEVKLYSAPLGAASIARAAKGEPVQYTPQMLLQTTPDPEAGKLRVVCDAAGMVAELGAGRSARLELVAKGAVEPLQRAEIRAFANDVGGCELPLQGVVPGDYDVRAVLLSDAGAEVARATSPFTMPGPPVWRGNELGRADRVLPPWTPLRTDAGEAAVACWGRRYDFGTLLRQACSDGTGLLSQPVSLEAVIAGKTVALQGPGCRPGRATDTRVTFSGQARAAGLRATVRHEVEFDGFTWTDLAVQADPPVQVDELRLTWRMPRTQATLMHADTLQWINSPAGNLKPEGWSSDFTHYFWLGNEDRGLSWYAESTRNWRLAKARPTIEVTPRGDQVSVTVRLIATPTTLSGRLDYGFGMMATPVRPRPPDARRWRMVPGVRADMDIVWPNANMKYYGYTEPEDPARFAALVKTDHDRNCLVVPYINLNFVSDGVPEWRYYGSRWADPGRVVTPTDVAAMGYASMGVCPASRDWQDFILYRISEMIDRYGVDGIYIDCWGPSPCSAGSCGWPDEAGKAQPTRPIRAYREILRRVYALFRERRPNARLMMHMSSEVVIPMLSFADTVLDGEQFVSGNLKGDYLEMLPPDRFRAEFLGRNQGPVDFFLPEFRGDFTQSGTPDLAAYLMLHDVNPWPIWSDAPTWNRMYEALDAIGIVEAQFVPYWQGGAARSSAQVLVSAYVAKTGAALALMNTGETTEAKVSLDLKRLGLTSVTGARDVLHDETLGVAGATLTVPLARHQGRVVVLTGE